jgi:hypothetical protein
VKQLIIDIQMTQKLPSYGDLAEKIRALLLFGWAFLAERIR